MAERVWTFCETCGWHSAGKFEQCPVCDSKKIRVVDIGAPPAWKGSDYFPLKEEVG
jgi:primosomal protein N'